MVKKFEVIWLTDLRNFHKVNFMKSLLKMSQALLSFSSLQLHVIRRLKDVRYLEDFYWPLRVRNFESGLRMHYLSFSNKKKLFSWFAEVFLANLFERSAPIYWFLYYVKMVWNRLICRSNFDCFGLTYTWKQFLK